MIELRVNGRVRRLEVEADMPLLWALREELGLTGTKFGCGVALCGACTVHLDGRPVRSCVIPIGELDGAEVTTIEGLAQGERLHVVQRAWIAEGAPQCGYCQSGQIMSAAALLVRTSAPTDAEIDGALAGNLCRCGTYVRIRRAVKRAAAELRGEGEVEVDAPTRARGTTTVSLKRPR